MIEPEFSHVALEIMRRELKRQTITPAKYADIKEFLNKYTRKVEMGANIEHSQLIIDYGQEKQRIL